uniref:Uncharacterized protein n=1 Tax=Anguilla anguilla TaxID=7936 RepID=A0A0E9PWN2_ANGAN
MAPDLYFSLVRGGCVV